MEVSWYVCVKMRQMRTLVSGYNIIIIHRILQYVCVPGGKSVELGEELGHGPA